MGYQRPSDFSNREKSDNYFSQGRLTRQQSVNQHYQDRDISTNSADRRTDSYFYSGKPTDQRPADRYGQQDSSRSSSSDDSVQRRSGGQPSVNQYGQRPSSSQSDRRTDSYPSTERYGQYQRTAGSPKQSSSSGYSSQRRPTGQPSANQYGQRPSSNPTTNQSDRQSEPYASSCRPVEQRPDDRYGQYQRPVQEENQRSAARQSVNPSSRNAAAYSPSCSSSEQHSVDRQGQYQRSTEDSSQSPSSDYSAQKRSTGQSSANHYGQRPSSNQSDRHTESAHSGRPADRYGQYQRPMQERNQRPCAQQAVNSSVDSSDKSASAYASSRRPADQRPVDRQGQYRQSAQVSRSIQATQSNKSSVSNPDSKKVPEKPSIDRYKQYTSDKNKHRKFPVKTIIIGVVALLVLSVFAVIRMKRNGGSISLPTGVPGEAEVTYNYIEDEQIIKKELIGTELTYESNNIASGTMKYRFKSVTAYDNVYELCGDGLKDNIDKPKMFKLDKEHLLWSYPDNGSKVYEGYSKYETYRDGTALYHYEYPSIIDLETGKLRNDCHVFVFEIELINVDALSNTTDTDINASNEFRIEDLLVLVNRSGEKPYYGSICYFAEEPDDDSDSSGLSYHVIINPGQAKTIHLGYFLIGDESEHPYSRMGLANEDMTSTYDDNTVFFWFDMSDVI